MPPKRRGMREMPVVGEPMGIEAAEKPLVGTPGGDPTTLVSAPTFPFALHPSLFLNSRSVPLCRRQSHTSQAKPIVSLCII